MPNEIVFNYIITIYNKENLIEQVLENVIKCCGKNSYIYPVLDGCTDDSEKIIDKIILSNQKIPITKVFTNDVHEILSINAGLRVASHDGKGYNIILQDDVVLEDFDLEKKIISLYEKEGEKLGYVSFRMGANLEKNALISKRESPYTDYIENVCGYGGGHVEMLPLGHIAYRTVPIKSPVCVPFKLVRELGLNNEKLAPYCHDDLDMGLRAISSGYYNLVYAIKFRSDLDWGGSRKEGHSIENSIIKRNMDYIRIWHRKIIKNIINQNQKTETKQIEENPVLSKKECEKIWSTKVKIISKLKYKLHPAYKRIKNSLNARVGKKLDRLKYSKLDSKFDKEFSFTEAVEYYKNRNDIHMYFHHYYNHRLPKVIKEHREYIEKNQKGFGEPAFHAMWWKLLLEFKPENCLEIGVYRGQVVSIWTLISKLVHHKIKVSGISPFSSFGDSVSEYMKNLDYYKDVQETFEDLNLEKPTFIKGFSNDEKAVEYIKSKTWDMIYIDGGHDYEDVLFDYKLCLENVRQGGLIIFDDASLYTGYNPVSFSFAGHPGPSLIAREYADKEMDFIGAVGHNNVYRKR